MSLAPGQILDGKYRIVRVLGTGGMGAVYEGENTRIHRRVAIKVLHAEVARKADIVQRFEREAQAAGRIGSEHIVEVLDLGNLPTGERYMVMEFLDGHSLTERIKRRGRLAPEEFVPVLLQLLEGLSAAHQAGIIHRDLKPDNVFIIRKSSGDFVKILDFGVSKFSALGEDFSMTKTGAVMGTPYYMSPEQARGQAIDARSDLYSIGVVAYQAFAGRVPFQAETFNELIFKIALEAPPPIETVVAGFDPQLAAIVRMSMERDPAHRFQSAMDFHRAIGAWASARVTSAPYGYPAVPPQLQGYPPAGPLASNTVAPAGGSPPTAAFAPSTTPAGTMAQSQVGVVVPNEATNRKGTVIAAIAAVLAVGTLAGLLVYRASGADDDSAMAARAASTTATTASSSPMPALPASSTTVATGPSPSSTTAPSAAPAEANASATATSSATPIASATSGSGSSPTAPPAKTAAPPAKTAAPPAKTAPPPPVAPPKSGGGRTIDTSL